MSSDSVNQPEGEERDKLGRFTRGHRPSKATEIKPGQHLSRKTEIKPGQRLSPATEFGNVPAHNKLPVGTVTVRTFKGKQRAWVKVAEPNKWKLRAVYVWEQVNGPVPNGWLVHHRDRNTLNDAIENLELQSRSEHLNEHRPELVAVRVRNRSQVKKSWPPCSECGDPDGPTHAGGVSPARISGKRFGIDGDLCKRCYQRLYLKQTKQ